MSRSKKRPRTSLKNLPDSFAGEGWDVPGQPEVASERGPETRPRLTAFQRVRHTTTGWEGVLLFALIQSGSWVVAWDDHPKASHKTEDLEGL